MSSDAARLREGGGGPGGGGGRTKSDSRCGGTVRYPPSTTSTTIEVEGAHGNELGEEREQEKYADTMLAVNLTHPPNNIRSDQRALGSRRSIRNATGRRAGRGTLRQFEVEIHLRLSATRKHADQGRGIERSEIMGYAFHLRAVGIDLDRRVRGSSKRSGKATPHNLDVRFAAASVGLCRPYSPWPLQDWCTI